MKKVEKGETKEPFCSLCGVQYPFHHESCPKLLENIEKEDGEETKEKEALEEKPVSDKEWFEEKRNRPVVLKGPDKKKLNRKRDKKRKKRGRKNNPKTGIGKKEKRRDRKIH